ncbi:hypothetical protein Tco_0460685, partial [Tanacetum coccineum]
RASNLAASISLSPLSANCFLVLSVGIWELAAGLLEAPPGGILESTVTVALANIGKMETTTRNSGKTRGNT